MKTAISIPDDVFAAAERLARRRRMSRSALYTEAVRRLLAESESGTVTEQLDDVYSDVDSGLDPALQQAQATSLREEW